MSKNNNTYQNTKIGFRQSNGPNQTDTLFADDDAIFEFYDGSNAHNASGKDMFAQNYVPAQVQVIADSAGVLSVVNLPISVGVIIFSTAQSNASAWLTSGPVQGQVLEMFVRGTESTGSVFISMSGVTMVGTNVMDLSSISLHASTNSMGYVKLICTTDGQWSIATSERLTVLQRSSV